MIQNVLRNIGTIGLYGVISISLFFAVFIAMCIWAACIKRKDLESAQRLPLEDSSSQ